MGFPKGASIPFAIILIGGGVNTPPAKLRTRRLVRKEAYFQ